MERKQGDWGCPECLYYNYAHRTDYNYAHRTVCLKCAASRPGNWPCGHCGRENREHRALCHWCRQPRGVEPHKRTRTEEDVRVQPEPKRRTKPDQKIIPYTGPPTRRPWRQQARGKDPKIIQYEGPPTRRPQEQDPVLARISAYKEELATPGAWEARRLVTPPAQQREPEHNQPNQTHDQPHQA